MFIDHRRSLPDTNPVPPPVTPSNFSLLNSKRLWLYVAIAVVVLGSGAGAFWYFSKRVSSPSTPVPSTPETPTGLPETLAPTENGPADSELSASDRKGETVTFGAYYQSLATEALDIKPLTVGLPLNVKSDVSNYYEVARKIDIDAAVGSLNKNGFAVIDNPLGDTAKDFFSAYNEIGKRGIPALVTSDFLLYYYQNSLKHIYQEIQASYFYDSLWKVNKQLFETANARYLERRKKVGLANDPLLEAERLEAGYFAEALALLNPETTQVNATEELNASRTFKPSEAKRYQFTPPAYIAEDVAAEMALIKEAKRNVKSPLFLYDRNYTDFTLPAEYGDSAKLRNFYLASRWQSALFPLNFKGTDCPRCLLDKDDWTINQISAFLISEDIAASQPIKNEWAKIYKVLSFFSGLRSDLTYLDYHAVREEIYPKQKGEDIFSSDAFNRLQPLREKLAAKKFPASAGGLNRTDPQQKNALGLRLLQTAFWPDRYLYDRLTMQAVGVHNRPRNARGEPAQYLTSCVNKERALYRCRGIGFDILGTASLLPGAGSFVADNINYSAYNNERLKLNKEINALPLAQRRSNNFWTTLDLLTAFVKDSFSTLPYSVSAAWRDRQQATGLAALTSLSLPDDEWEAARSASTSLETGQSSLNLNYVEPNRLLSDELVADATMLFQALSNLGVVKDNDDRFAELVRTLQGLRSIARTELSGGTLAPGDYQLISDIIGRYRIVTQGSKTSSVVFYDPLSDRNLSVKQSVAPLKLLLLVYEKDGKKVLAVGPVFSYKEE